MKGHGEKCERDAGISGGETWDKEKSSGGEDNLKEFEMSND